MYMLCNVHGYVHDCLVFIHIWRPCFCCAYCFLFDKRSLEPGTFYTNHQTISIWRSQGSFLACHVFHFSSNLLHACIFLKSCRHVCCNIYTETFWLKNRDALKSKFYGLLCDFPPPLSRANFAFLPGRIIVKKVTVVGELCISIYSYVVKCKNNWSLTNNYMDIHMYVFFLTNILCIFFSFLSRLK